MSTIIEVDINSQTIEVELVEDVLEFSITEEAIAVEITVSPDVTDVNLSEESIEVDVTEDVTEVFLDDPIFITDGAGTTERINALELELVLASENPEFYKEFYYDVDDNITGIKLFTAPDKITELFDVVFTFVDEVITQKVVTRNSDSAILTIDFDWTGDNLTSQTRSIL